MTNVSLKRFELDKCQSVCWYIHSFITKFDWIWEILRVYFEIWCYIRAMSLRWSAESRYNEERCQEFVQAVIRGHKEICGVFPKNNGVWECFKATATILSQLQWIISATKIFQRLPRTHNGVRRHLWTMYRAVW